MATTTKNNESEVKENFESLKDDFRKFREDMTELIHSLVDAGKQKGAKVGGRLKDAAEEGYEKVKDGAESVQQIGVNAKKSVESRIEENPLPSVLIAMGLGVLLGKFFRK